MKNKKIIIAAAILVAVFAIAFTQPKDGEVFSTDDGMYLMEDGVAVPILPEDL